MSSLQELLPDIYFIPGSTNVGVISIDTRGTRTIYLIDSGGSTDAGAHIYEELENFFGKNKFTLKAVINTHSHADHSGGNDFFVKKTGCGVWMSYLEKGSMENTLIQSSVAWGGYPLPELRTSYYVPSQCSVTRIISGGDKLTLADGKTLSFIPLQGHYFGMLGVECTTKDGKNAVFTGDAIFGRKVISKFSIPFMYNVGEFMKSLDTLCRTEADWYVPSHGDAVTRIQETAEMNKLAVLETIECVVSILTKKTLSAEELLTEVANENEIPLKLPQYVLIGSTLRSYLSYLYETGRITYVIENNKMIWSVKKRNISQ
ncbi:MAG: MBL fold metallo-hydrolase [Treponema sp.]|nr:MBL fold metallo-hydrolase [Treponema sp.]